MPNEEEPRNEDVKPEAEKAPQQPETAEPTPETAATDQPPVSEKPAASEAPAEVPTPTAEAKSEAPVEKTEAPVAQAAEPVGEEKPAATAEKPATAEEAKPKKTRARKTKATKSEGSSGSSPVSISLDDPIEKPKIVRAKGSKNVTSGIAHVQATFNNTLVSITDLNGNVLGWSSAGKCGFKGSRKSTAYAAQMVAQDACRQAMGHGLKEVEVRVKGPGSGRESAVRAMQAIGLDITTIKDVTPVPHNGCRPPKQRRV